LRNFWSLGTSPVTSIRLLDINAYLNQAEQ
jgi:hypothetical protein